MSNPLASRAERTARAERERIVAELDGLISTLPNRNARNRLYASGIRRAILHIERVDRVQAESDDVGEEG